MAMAMLRVDVNARRKPLSPTYRTSEEIQEGHKKYAHRKLTKMVYQLTGEDSESIFKVLLHTWHKLIARYDMSEVNAANSLEADTARILRGDYMDLGSNRVAVWSVYDGTITMYATRVFEDIGELPITAIGLDMEHRGGTHPTYLDEIWDKRKLIKGDGSIKVKKWLKDQMENKT